MPVYSIALKKIFSRDVNAYSKPGSNEAKTKIATQSIATLAHFTGAAGIKSFEPSYSSPNS
jgi:hypothetical protein